MPPPDASVPQVPGLDLAGAMARMDMSWEEMKELLAVFPDAVRDQAAKVAEVPPGDMPAMRFAAHALAGLAANYGAQPLWMASKDLETAARDGKSAEVPALLAKVGALAKEAVASAELALK